MGFGKKTDFETGRVLDLDKSYRNMIKPAVEATGLKCIRADEIVHSGLIDVPMYEQLLNADVVVADLSTSNKNAFYELGVRHALRPHTTVIIAEDGAKTFPFDINHITVRQYHHMGEDIGFDEAMRFRALLIDAITKILEKNPVERDSPVYAFLEGLTPPVRAAVKAAVQQAANQNKLTKDNEVSSSGMDQTHSVLMQQVDDAQKRGDWITAKTMLSAVRQLMKSKAKINEPEPPEDPYIIQRLTLITYKSKFPNERDALIEAHLLLHLMDPFTTNDTETLGLWGAVHKRLWELDKLPKYINQAVRAYGRGFYLRNDYYNGINFAFLLNVRAHHATDRAEAITDYVEAARIRKEVLVIAGEWLEKNPMPVEDELTDTAMNGYLKSWYWVKASIGEAYVGLGDETSAEKVLQEAYDKAPEGWMKASTEEQLAKLRPILVNSPLEFIKRD